MSNDLDQWVTQTEIAAMKGGMSLSKLAYHLGREGAPKFDTRYGRKVYRLSEVDAWEPNTMTKRKK